MSVLIVYKLLNTYSPLNCIKEQYELKKTTIALNNDINSDTTSQAKRMDDKSKELSKELDSKIPAISDLITIKCNLIPQPPTSWPLRYLESL